MMFPRISKFSNLSTTPSQAPSMNSRGDSVAKRNDSTNIKNLIFGGYEEPPSQMQKGGQP